MSNLIEELRDDIRNLRQDFAIDYLDQVADRIECLIEHYEGYEDDGQPDDVKEQWLDEKTARGITTWNTPVKGDDDE
jgi:hypothetical protein